MYVRTVVADAAAAAAATASLLNVRSVCAFLVENRHTRTYEYN